MSRFLLCCLIGFLAGSTAAQSIYQDSKGLAQLIKSTQEMSKGDEYWIKRAASSPFLQIDPNIVSGTIQDAQYEPLEVRYEMDVVLVRTPTSNDRIEIYDVDTDSVLFYTYMKYDFYLFRFVQFQDEKDRLLIYGPSGRLLEREIGHFIDAKGKIAVRGGFKYFKGGKNGFSFNQFENNRQALELDIIYYFPNIFSSGKLTLTEAGRNLLTIRSSANRDSIFVDFDQRSTQKASLFSMDTTKEEQARQAFGGQQILLTRNLNRIRLLMLDSYEIIELEVGPYPMELVQEEVAKRILVKDFDLQFPDGLPMAKNTCLELYDQLVIGRGNTVVEVLKLLPTRVVKSVQYNESSRSIEFVGEKILEQRSNAQPVYRRRTTLKNYAGSFELNLKPTLKYADYSCDYRTDVKKRFDEANLLFNFNVYDIGPDGTIQEVATLNQQELAQKSLGENMLYQIVLPYEAMVEGMGDFSATDLYFRLGTARLGTLWYPAMDSVLQVFVQDSTINYFFAPMIVEERYSVPVYKMDSLSVLLGTHSQLRQQDLDVTNLWGDISLKYRNNPFLGASLKDVLAKNSFETIPGISNFSLSGRIESRVTEYYGWQQLLFQKALPKIESGVAYDEVASTYRSRIPTAADKLQVASEQFGSERNKLKRSLSTADLAVGLSDFVVERAQEELNVTFLDRFRENMVNGEKEFAVLFPQTERMMREFNITQYRTLLDFAKVAFVQDLDNLALNFPKLLNELAKAESLRNDPKVYNIFLLYDIANKVYEGMPVDTVLLHIHGRLQEQKKNVESTIQRRVALRIEQDTAAQAELSQLVAQYMEALAEYEEKMAVLNQEAIPLQQNLLNEAQRQRRLNNEPNMRRLYKLLSAVALASPVQEGALRTYQYLSNTLKGDPDYPFLLDSLPFDRYNEFFAKPPLPHETISFGLGLSQTYISPELSQRCTKSLDKFEEGLVSYEEIQDELAQKMASEAVAVSNYLPMLKKLKAVQTKRAALRMALQTEMANLAISEAGDYEVSAWGYLLRILASPQSYELFDWFTIDQFCDSLLAVNMDSFMVIRNNKAAAVLMGPSRQNNSFDELKLLSTLSNSTNQISAEIERANTFMDKLAAVMQAQLPKIKASGKYRAVLNTDTLYRYFVYSEQLTNGSVLLDYRGLEVNMDTVLASVVNGEAIRRTMYQNIENETAIAYYDSLMQTEMNRPLTPTGNAFLDYYDQIIPFTPELSTEKNLSKEVSDLRAAIVHIEEAEQAYKHYLAQLYRQYAPDLMPSLQQAEQFDTLTNITLVWLNAFKNGALSMDSIVVKDTALIHIVNRTQKGVEYSYDSVAVSDRRIASGPGLRRWITPQQFNEMMEDSLMRRAFLGLMYQRLASVEGGLTYSAPNMALLATKMMNTIYGIDEARELLHYKKKNNQPLGFEDYYPFIRTTIDMLNVVLETPVSSDGRSLKHRFSTLENVPFISNESLSLFENIFAQNYALAIRNVVQLLSITWGLDPKTGANLSSKKPNSTEKATLKRNEKIKSAILVYGSFMANMVGARTPDQVKAAIAAVAVPPGNSSVKRTSKANVGINSYLGVGVSRETLNTTVLEPSQRSGMAFGLSLPIGVSFSSGQHGRHGRQSFTLFTPIFDLGAVTTYRLNSTGITSDLPKLTIGNIIAPGVYGLWNIPRSPFTLGVGAQYGPQLRKVTYNNTEITPSAWRIGATFSVDVPLFNVYTKP